MAGDWIKWVKGLSRRREVLVIARKLNLSRREAACCCMEVWEWADDETVDGHIRGATRDDIDLMLGIPGFAAALESSEVCWVKINSTGISFPRWDRNNSESAKRRATESRKKQRQRDLQRKPVSRRARDKCPDDDPLTTGTRGEERREDNIKPAAAPVVEPGSAAPAAAKAAPDRRKQQQQRVFDLRVDQAAKAIDAALANGCTHDEIDAAVSAYCRSEDPPGFLYLKLTAMQPGESPERRFTIPKPAKKEPRPDPQKAAEDLRHSITYDGRRAGKTREQIDADLVAAGLNP